MATKFISALDRFKQNRDTRTKQSEIHQSKMDEATRTINELYKEFLNLTSGDVQMNDEKEDKTSVKQHLHSIDSTIDDRAFTRLDNIYNKIHNTFAQDIGITPRPRQIAVAMAVYASLTARTGVLRLSKKEKVALWTVPPA